MKSKIFLFTVLTFSLLAFQSCNDDDDNHLPAITQDGYNTAGYKLNGKVILPKGTPPTWSNPSGNKGLRASYSHEELYDYGNHLFNLQLNNYNEGDNSSIRLDLKKSVLEDSLQYLFVSIYGNNGRDTYALENGNIDWIRKDTINRVYAATFSAILRNNENNESVEITDGRFDVNLNTINTYD